MSGGNPTDDTLRQAWLDYRRMLDEAFLELRGLRRRVDRLETASRRRCLPLAIMLEAASQMGLSQKAYVTKATHEKGCSHE